MPHEIEVMYWQKMQLFNTQVRPKDMCTQKKEGYIFNKSIK